MMFRYCRRCGLGTDHRLVGKKVVCEICRRNTMDHYPHISWPKFLILLLIVSLVLGLYAGVQRVGISKIIEVLLPAKAEGAECGTKQIVCVSLPERKETTNQMVYRLLNDLCREEKGKVYEWSDRDRGCQYTAEYLKYMAHWAEVCRNGGCSGH